MKRIINREGNSLKKERTCKTSSNILVILYTVQLHQGSESKFKITTNVNMSCDNGRGVIQNGFD